MTRAPRDDHHPARPRRPLDHLRFVPWIAFTAVAQRLAADGVAWAAVIAAALGLMTIAWERRRHTPALLDGYSLVLFVVIAIAGFAGGPRVDEWLYDWGRPLVGVVLGLTLLATCTIRPFTADYAKQTTPREYWDSPVFRRINLVLSAAWGAAITVMGAAAVLVTTLDARPTDLDGPYLLDLALNWGVPVVVIVVMVRFTNTYPAGTAGA